MSTKRQFVPNVVAGSKRRKAVEQAVQLSAQLTPIHPVQSTATPTNKPDPAPHREPAKLFLPTNQQEWKANKISTNYRKGVAYKQKQVSEGRKLATSVIRHLVSHFSAPPSWEREMQRRLMDVTMSKNLQAAAAAVFLVVWKERHGNNDSTVQPPTVEQVEAACDNAKITTRDIKHQSSRFRTLKPSDS